MEGLKDGRGDGFDPGDIFGNFFGGPFGGNRRRSQQPGIYFYMFIIYGHNLCT